MEIVRKIRRAGVPLVIAVVAVVGFTGSLLISAAVARDRLALPGGGVSTGLYVVLGYFALRRHAWARWVMFTLVLLQALTCLLFTFVDMGGPKPRLGFTPRLAALAGFYLAVAVGLAVPSPANGTGGANAARPLPPIEERD